MSLNSIEKLRIWCQKVLPLVYDDSLSYYEVLTKVVNKLNEVIALAQEQNETIEEALSDIDTFKTDMTSQFESYKTTLNAALDAFETEITAQQSGFEGRMTQEFADFMADYEREFGITNLYGDSTTLAISQNQVSKLLDYTTNNNRFNPEVITSGKAIDNTGAVIDNPNTAVTGYIEVQPGENIVAQAKNNTTNERYQGAGTGTDVPLVFDSIAGYDEELTFVAGSYKSLVFNYQVPAGVKYIKIAMGQTILDGTNTDMSELAIVNSDGTIYPYQPYSEQNATVKMNALPVDDTQVGNHLWSANKINAFQAAVEAEIEQLETDLTGTVQGAVGDMNAAFAQKSAELDTKFDTLEGSIQAEQEAFETEIEGALASQKTELETEIGEVASDVQTLSGSVTTQGQTITNLTGIVTSIDGRVDTLETDMAAAKSDITDLEASDAQQSTDITGLKGRMTAAEGDIDTLETASEEHGTAISNLQAKDAELVGDINGLSTRMGAAEGDIDLLEGRTDALETDVADLEENTVRYNTAQNKSKSEKHQAIKNIIVYDNILQTIKITSLTTTMGDISQILTEVKSDGDYVVFDVSAFNNRMYLCSIYIDAGYYRIADMITGIEKHGFCKNSDLLIDILNSTSTVGKHYTIQWDKVNAKGVRLNDAASITDNTENFGHFGSVNENYDNPFDNIYPWSGRKLCNIDLETYRGLTAGDDITDCVVAWEGDVNFDYEHEYGVWVYTPSFFGRTYELGNYRYFDVTNEFNQHNISYPAMITARWLGVDIELSIDGTSKHCNISKQGMPIANVTMANQHLYATNWGASLDDIYSLDASTLLFVVEYATLNSQTTVGNGCSNLYKQSMHPDADVTNGTVISVTASGLNTTIVREGAIVDIGTRDGGNNVARTSIVSATISGNTATITLADAVTVTTAHFVSLHGIINMADEKIGSKSGYIGTNGYVNAYYRGEALWGNKYYYVLGAYRQTGTQHIWIADRDDTDNYDALNTSEHTDTGLVLPNETNEAKYGYVNKLGIAEGLSIPPFATEIGGNSANPVGDYVYVPPTSGDNTVLLVGGAAGSGTSGGSFYGDWRYSSASSYWSSGSRPRLVNP